MLLEGNLATWSMGAAAVLESQPGLMHSPAWLQPPLILSILFLLRSSIPNPQGFWDRIP